MHLPWILFFFFFVSLRITQEKNDFLCVILNCYNNDPFHFNLKAIGTQYYTRQTHKEAHLIFISARQQSEHHMDSQIICFYV